MKKQSDDIILELAEKLPSQFADGMTNALMQVAKGVSSIGDAFRDMAINFGQMIMQEVMRAAIGKVVGSIGSSLFQKGGIVGKQRGGIIYAENGMYIPGNRTGDRNLAMLEDGEYVLNRQAVQAIGVNNLNGLNFGMAPRFQKGGIAKFAQGGSFGGGFMIEPQYQQIGDEYSPTGNILQSNMPAKPIDYADYSSYALAEDEYFKETKRKSVEDFQRGVQERFQAKAKEAQLISSIVGAIGSIALSVGMGGVTGGIKAPTKGPVGNNTMSGRPASMGNFAQTGGLVSSSGIGRYQSGGFIPYGSRISDNVPKYMSGGNVINNPSFKKFTNSSVSMLQSGGQGLNTSNTYNQNQNNATQISINIDKDSKTTIGSSTNSYKPNEVALSKEMALAVNNTVKQMMKNEKRYNGMLSQKA